VHAAPTPPLAEDLAAANSRLGRWPFGLLVVAVLRLIAAAGLLLTGLGYREGFGGLPLVESFPIVSRVLEVTIAVLAVVGVIGLLQRRRWGWVLTMVLTGVGLLAQIVRVINGQPDFLGLALLVATAFYLNQRSVRAMARRHLEHRAAPVPISYGEGE
jgi:hypothetical protein